MATHESVQVESAKFSLLPRPVFDYEVVKATPFFNYTCKDEVMQYLFGYKGSLSKIPVIPPVKQWLNSGVVHRLVDLTAVRDANPGRFRQMLCCPDGEIHVARLARELMSDVPDVKLWETQAGLVTIGAAEKHRFLFGQDIDLFARICMRPIIGALGLYQLAPLLPLVTRNNVIVLGGLGAIVVAVAATSLKNEIRSLVEWGTGVVLIARAPVMRQSGQVLLP